MTRKFDTFVYNCPVCKEDTTSKIITIFGENKLLTIGDKFINGEMEMKHSPCELCKAVNIVVAKDGKIIEFKHNPHTKPDEMPGSISEQDTPVQQTEGLVLDKIAVPDVAEPPKVLDEPSGTPEVK